MGMYTDPARLRATDPGKVENNPMWIFHDTFNPDKTWINEAKDRYLNGQIGDVECKKMLIEVLDALIEPIRMRRQAYEKSPERVLEVLREGTEKANFIAEQTLIEAKKAMGQDYFVRDLKITTI